MHETTELIRAIAWPLTTLVIFLILRVELQRFAKNMADRIRSANSITIGARGFELKGLLKAVPLAAGRTGPKSGDDTVYPHPRQQDYIG